MTSTLSSPLLLDSDASIVATFYRVAESHPEHQLYTQPVLDLTRPNSKFVKLQRSLRQVKSRINRIASFLGGLGVSKGTKVAIISNTRPEWLECDLAILACGGIVISIYQSLPANEIGYILLDSGAEIVFAENQEQLGKLFQLLSAPCPVPATEERPASQQQVNLKCIVAFESVDPHEKVVTLQSILDIQDPGVPAGISKLSRGDLASFVYTSGTTGPPKGVMQTHGNHLANVRQAFQANMYRPGDKFFLLLPLAHSFAKLMGYLCFLGLTEISFPAVSDKLSSKADPKKVLGDMHDADADIIPIVPRILEKMQEGILAKSNKGGFSATLLKLAIVAAQKCYASKLEGAQIFFGWRLIYSLTSKIRHKIKRALFGRRLNYIVSGGAKLPPSVGSFFSALGICIIEGYGLTETCVATNVNRLDLNKIGTVGPVMAKDIEMQILEDGEIVFRGPNISLGYFNRPVATKAAWDSGGWFHTGDLGSIDSDGYLSIVGRKKELIVSSNGKKIAPDPIEQKLKASQYISQGVIFGEGRPFCVALVHPDSEAVKSWALRQNISFSDLFTDDRVRALLWAEVEGINAGLAGFEQIRRIALVSEEFTVENGLLTPTFKVRRSLVYRKYADTISELYS